MTRSEYNDDGEPSPLSSALGSQSPELETKRGNQIPKKEGTGSLSGQTPDHSDSSGMKLPLDSSPSEHDHMARSPLFEHERGLGSSGLRRIRQQPSPRLISIPSASTSSSFIAPPLPRTSSTPHSSSSSRATSTCFPPDPTSPALEDLHRFPSESLHSFSFAKQSEELLHNRQNILKRSIDFMKDRFGWAASNAGIANAQARISGDSEVQSMMDLLARANMLEKDGEQGQSTALSGGPLSGPAEVNGDNIFDKAFAEQPPQSRNMLENGTDSDVSDSARFLSPVQDDTISCQRRDLKSAPSSRRVSLKRTFTDINSVSLQGRLTEALAQPYSIADSVAYQLLSPNGMSTINGGPTLHSHSSKWAPVAQAVFRTESESPWTIIAANDLACLVFGVTQAEVKKLSILEVVQKDRREWLETKLRAPSANSPGKPQNPPDVPRAGATNSKSMMMGNGVTAQLLNKPPSRQKPIRRAQTDDGYGSSYNQGRNTKKSKHPSTKSRGVLLCGDVVPIQKRNGATGSASLWVMEKRGGLIWVLEEITEDVAYLRFDEEGRVKEAQGDVEQIWGQDKVKSGTSITYLLPNIPKEMATTAKDESFSKIAEMKYFAARTSSGMRIPTTVTQVSGPRDLRVSCFPHVAGMMVLSSSTLKIISSNSVFSSALFGKERPEGSHVTDLIPGFDDFLTILTEEDNMPLVDGIVIPEQSFRRAKAILVLRGGKADPSSVFLQPTGLPAKHRDGSEITVDVQMRIVKSETFFTEDRGDSVKEQDESDSGDGEAVGVTEVVYALWITYSRQLHSTSRSGSHAFNNALLSRPGTPPAQPSPGQQLPSPPHIEALPVVSPAEGKPKLSLLTQQLTKGTIETLTGKPITSVSEVKAAAKKAEMPVKKTIAEYVILEEMGQGAYGQVKLARCKKNASKKVVLKYVTKRRILVDTWTRDRRLGTVPLEIHVLDYLRRDEFSHPNIVEMEGFFEDDVNYYIEMVPHGLPGMDLFDYIELRTNMDEGECRNIFRQVVDAIRHLHTKALVVHRDIKDENVILNGEGKIKLIDFGSASYIKNGPFDVFVGTIDYAAPEVLQGKSYRGKEQDVWALGILLYTIVYKENPFYNIDEILDHPLRVPFIPFSEDCIDLVRKMLDRDVDERLTITEVMEHPWMTET